MKLLETAILSPNPRYLEEVLAPLEVQKDSVLNIDTYRYEVDEELVMLMYDLKPEARLPEELLEHLNHHLAGLLILADETVSQLPDPEKAFIDKLSQNLSGSPVVMAVRMAAGQINSLNPDIIRSGFYLSEKGRVIFWHPELPDSLRRIWKLLWATLPSAQPAAE